MLTSFSWTVSTPSAGGGGGGSGGTSPLSSFGVGASDPLGTGIVRPFRRTARADFDTASGVPEVLSCIGQLFGTDVNTLPWRVDFGIDLQRLRLKNNTTTLAEIARVKCSEALQKWEPRAVLKGVAAARPKPNVLELVITVQIGGKILTIRVPV